MEAKEIQDLTSKQYEKLADWAERFGLGTLGAIVAQEIIQGKPLTSWSVMFGALIATAAYTLGFKWLKQIK